MRSLHTATREQPQCINKDSAQPNIINKRNEVLKIYLWGVRVFIHCRVCLTLCDPTSCSLPGSSVHGILHARILELIAISSSRGSSWPRDQTCPPPALTGRFFTTKSPGKFLFPKIVGKAKYSPTAGVHYLGRKANHTLRWEQES